jgi:hypothetical protein
MKWWRSVNALAIATLALGVAGVASAQAPEKPNDNLDLTMTLLPEHATGPEEITRRIELPRPEPKPAEQGKGAGEEGTEKHGSDANGPPENPSDHGRETSTEARERGREAGQDVAEHAREDRENAGRGNGNGNGTGGGPPESPPGKPDKPGK